MSRLESFQISVRLLVKAPSMTDALIEAQIAARSLHSARISVGAAEINDDVCIVCCNEDMMVPARHVPSLIAAGIIEVNPEPQDEGDGYRFASEDHNLESIRRHIGGQR